MIPQPVVSQNPPLTRSRKSQLEALKATETAPQQEDASTSVKVEEGAGKSNVGDSAEPNEATELLSPGNEIIDLPQNSESYQQSSPNTNTPRGRSRTSRGNVLPQEYIPLQNGG